jgi:5-methylcytosine-specific restriction endonuclease McrA
MPRSVTEWIATHADQAVPERVKVRVFDLYDGKCYLTGVKLRPGHWEVEHIIALSCGGEHRERNLAPAAVKPHKAKSAKDMATKAKIYRQRKKDIGVDKPRRGGFRGWTKMDGTPVWKDQR